MPIVNKLIFKNFKRFGSIEFDLDKDRSVLVGDNECGKSSILLALDLVLSGNRQRVETIGLETLFNRDSIQQFLSGKKEFADLPKIVVEAYLTTDGKNPDINGKNNEKKVECDGLRMECRPDEKLSQEIAEILSDDEPNFPFEFYETVFKTFGDHAYSNYTRHVRHLSIDSSKIDSDYAAREYTRSVFEVNTEPTERSKLENAYRNTKSKFATSNFVEVNKKTQSGKFALKTAGRSNLDSDLIITEDEIPLDSRGKGKQCIIKTEFALAKGASQKGIDVLLLEEPENHLSHVNMRKLIDRIASSKNCQLVIATHSSLVLSRLDLRKAVLLGGASADKITLATLNPHTATFFMKAPDNYLIEFVLSRKVILVEGDAEFILMDLFYRKQTSGSTLERDGVHVIAVGGTTFKRYMELAKFLGIKAAVIRDNDGKHQETCVKNYEQFVTGGIKVFADSNDKRNTFEVCIYEDNTKACDDLFAAGRKTRSVQQYMLDEKAEAAFQLLDKKGDELVAPEYIKDAIAWIRA